MVDGLIAAIRYRRLLILISAITGILFFLVTQEIANATVPLTSENFDLISSQEKPRGVWGDGTTLWVAENDGDSSEYIIVTYKLNSGERHHQGEFHLSDDYIKIQGIWSDDSVMWIADWDDKKLYAYGLNKQSNNNTQRIPEKDISLAGSNDHPKGVWGFGTTIFVVDRDDTYVYAYSTTDGSRLNNEEFDLHGDNDHPWGIWGEGTTVWISDVTDDMLYVYERNPNSPSHGDHKPTLDIRLPLENDDPTGIWSDGQTMWVADDEDDKIYAMHFRDFRHPEDEVDISHVGTPTGIWTDGTIMWAADAGRSDHGKLLAYNLSAGTRRPAKDVQLQTSHLEPLSMWSDGTTAWVVDDGQINDFLFAYYRDPEPNEVGLLVPYKSITLHSNNADPVGTWSDGETIWVSDSGDGKLYAYDLSDKSRQSSQDIGLVNANDDPRGIWSDGQTVWVMDAGDKHAYAYDLSSGSRREAREFSTVPDNDHPTGGLTGHELRFWVADSDDEMLYAYGGVNTSPTFTGTSASLKIHRTVGTGDYVGTIPQVTDPDGDTITYLLTSGGLGVFRLDSQTGELFVTNDATSFSGGEEYTLTVSVTDGKSWLDGLSSEADDAINVTINVTRNADPEFTTADGTVFSVAEDATHDTIIARLGITDLDGDSIFYQITSDSRKGFWFYQGELKLLYNETLDYESMSSFVVNMRARDNKNDLGGRDFTWDDELEITIQVTNLDEAGELVLNSAHPQVGVKMVATLTDPDEVDFSNGNQVSWTVERSADSIAWTQVSVTNSSSTNYEYTPVTADADMYLRFTATYRDGFDTVNAASLETETDKKVLADPPTNRPPTFDADTPQALSVSEDAALGSNVGSPISATDPESDTLTFELAFSTTDLLDITSDGQLFVKYDSAINYEERTTLFALVWVRDSKDHQGVADTEWDTNHLVRINVANADEAGSVILSPEYPEVGVTLTARLQDPDRVLRNVTWQWQTADSAEATTWTDIADATLDSYLPVMADTGKYLRAKTSYNDGEGAGKEATGTSTTAVGGSENEAPEFNEGSSATRTISENAPPGTSVGAVVAATDPEDDALSYSLALGTDADKFSIDSTTGRLEVASGALLDYETDPSLEITLQVTDGRAADHSQDDSVDATIVLTISLENVDEPGTVNLSMGEPEVGTSITATLTDPDVVNSSDWHWEKSQDGENGWISIQGGDTDEYIPASSDVGMYLRAMVDYTDGEGAGKSASGKTADTVKSPPVDTSLASLKLGSLSLTFSSSTLQYSVTAPNGKKRVKVTATPTASSGVSVQITPADSRPNRNGHQVELAVGETEITVTVSEDQGSGSTTYTAVVTKGQQDPPQQDPPTEDSVADKCRNDLRDGLIANCQVGKFAVVRVELDGGFTIDWSKWDEVHPDVTGYDIVSNELLYKRYFDENGQVSDIDAADVYESCEFVNSAWNCVGRMGSNYFEDWDGNPTEIQELASNEDRTEWISSLEKPGVHVFNNDFVRWSGDATDSNNEPTDVSYQVKVFEMDLYYFFMYEGGQTSGGETIVVTGANGFDGQEG